VAATLAQCADIVRKHLSCPELGGVVEEVLR
jgi:hypothetical protein